MYTLNLQPGLANTFRVCRPNIGVKDVTLKDMANQSRGVSPQSFWAVGGGKQNHEYHTCQERNLETWSLLNTSSFQRTFSIIV